MTKLPISVCVIAGNEAHRLSRTLKSVTDWTTEIIVVLNTTVNDGTDRIAAAHGARVFRHAWEGYAVQRNFATAQAMQPWLFAIDADEVVSDALREEIIKTFKNLTADSGVAAYSFPRLSFFCGRWIHHGDWYPDRKVRLWRKGAGEWQGQLHERLVLQGSVARLRGDLLHFSNDSVDQLIGKVAPFSTLSAEQMITGRKRVGWLDLAIRPGWKFFRAYIIRLGFLDGWQGYFIAWVNAFSTIARQAKVREAEFQKTRQPD